MNNRALPTWQVRPFLGLCLAAYQNGQQEAQESVQHPTRNERVQRPCVWVLERGRLGKDSGTAHQIQKDRSENIKRRQSDDSDLCLAELGWVRDGQFQGWRTV